MSEGDAKDEQEAILSTVRKTHEQYASTVRLGLTAKLKPEKGEGRSAFYDRCGEALANAEEEAAKNAAAAGKEYVSALKGPTLKAVTTRIAHRNTTDAQRKKAAEESRNTRKAWTDLDDNAVAVLKPVFLSILKLPAEMQLNIARTMAGAALGILNAVSGQAKDEAHAGEGSAAKPQ
jgi:hypothetical protein